MRIAVHGPQRHVAYYDCHVPHHIDFTQILEFQKFYKPSHIVIGGDFLNMENCSHWNEGMFKEVGYGRLRANILGEMAAGSDLLCRIRCASPQAEIFYVPGNHENHVFWAAQHHPALGIATHVDTSKINFKCDMAKAGNDATAAILEDMLKTESMKIHVLPYNEELTIGKITYLHGHQLSVSNSQRLYPGANIVYGHYHTDNLITLNDSGDGQVKQHRAVPCMTHLGPQKPGYLKSKSTRWLNGLWLAEVLPNGLFDGRVKKILGGKVMVP